MRHNITWTPEIISHILETYPHVGLKLTSQKFGISRNALRSKTNGMKLAMLPKSQRLCIDCWKEKQQFGLKCLKCLNSKRVMDRKINGISLDERLREMVRNSRRRSKLPPDINFEFVKTLYDKQEGKCFYTGLPMLSSVCGQGRILEGISLDQLEPGKGYTKKNLVLCRWQANAAKNIASVQEFINFCKIISERENEILFASKRKIE